MSDISLNNLYSSNKYWKTIDNNIITTNTGNLGIGITTPDYKLHVIGTITSTDNICTSTGYVGIGSTAYNTAKLYIYEEGAGTVATKDNGTFVIDRDNVGESSIVFKHKGVTNNYGFIKYVDNADDSSVMTLGSIGGANNKLNIAPGGGATGLVGINKANPLVALDVTGALAVSGATNLSSTLGVTGATTLNNNVTIANGKTLSVGGATTLSSTLGVTGNTTLSSTLGVTGATTLTGTLQANNNVTIANGKTLSVGGATTLSSTLGVTGNTTLTGGVLIGTTFTGTDKLKVNGTISTNNNNINAGTGTITGNGSGLTSLNMGATHTGILIVARGGTGVSTFTSGKILFGNGNSAINQNTNLHWDNVNNRLGIGKTNPGYTVDVTGNINLTGNLTKNGLTLSLIGPQGPQGPQGAQGATGPEGPNQIGSWKIESTSGVGYNLVFRYGTVIKGYIDKAYDNRILNFTGQHHCTPSNTNLFNSKYYGYIVKSTGEYKNMYYSIYKNKNRNITINDSLPIIELTNKINTKNVLGVISNSNVDFNFSPFKQEGKSYKKGEEKLNINSLGEGALWVSDYNGNIENGDYITSSPIPGIGMKQDDDILYNYTVAKITMDCDFNPKYLPLERMITYTSNVFDSSIKVERSIELTSNMIFTSNVIVSNYDNNSILTSNIQYSSNITYTSNYDTYGKYVEEIFNYVDENNELIYETVYDANSNIIYEPEYEMKYIYLDGTITTKDNWELNNITNNIYRMALCGCTYHCG